MLPDRSAALPARAADGLKATAELSAHVTWPVAG